MTSIQFAGLVLGVALAGMVRGVIRPRYQAWVVRQVQKGRWTEREAMRFDHRVDMAIWLPVALLMGAGLWAFKVMVTGTN